MQKMVELKLTNLDVDDLYQLFTVLAAGEIEFNISKDRASILRLSDDDYALLLMTSSFEIVDGKLTNHGSGSIAHFNGGTVGRSHVQTSFSSQDLLVILADDLFCHGSHPFLVVHDFGTISYFEGYGPPIKESIDRLRSKYPDHFWR